MRWTLVALAIAGCAPAADPTTLSPDSVSREIAGRSTGPAQACVDTVPQQNVRALDSATLAYDQGPVLWVNRLTSACPGVRPGNITIVETRSGQFCRGDHVRGLDQGGNIPGPVCFLGDWTPYRS